MTTTEQQPPAPPHPPTERPPMASLGRTVAVPAVAGLATICTATSLTGVIQGPAWLGYLVVATVLVGCTGLALRSLRLATPLVGAGQLLVLLLLVTGAFTRSGMLAIIPGPAAFGELNDVLVQAFQQIRTGMPPVEATAPILCLVTIAIGLVAIVVDTLAVAAAAPAATGLVLLCVYAVPSALAGELLPWWTFVCGAGSFAALLAVDGSHRHKNGRNRSAPGTGTPVDRASTPVSVVAASLVVGLVAGSTVTVIGTEGSLPGSASGAQTVPGGLGVHPFTSLRGMLDQGRTVELFRVQGLGDDRRLLRAFTLDTYRPNQGWTLPDGPMPAGVPANEPLPPAPGDDGSGESRRIRIEPVHWNDVWLPVYGAPRSLHDVSDGWYYDLTSGSVFRERRQRPGPYVEVASLREPTKDELRQAARAAADVPPSYTDASGIDPRVATLARELTQGKKNDFDRAEAIWRYFSARNGFVYDTETAPRSDSDAIADFLFNGKRGFCEQYASSMAVMVRALGIPSRVAIGFTTGSGDNRYRTITTKDAHAWVEVYFADHGWVSFDPTPLSDGRGFIPPYLRSDNPDSDAVPQADDEAPSASATQPSQDTPPQSPGATGSQAASPSPDGAPSWSGWGALALAVAALAMTVAVFLFGRRATPARRRTGRSAPWLPWVAGALWLAALVLVGWWSHWSVAVALLVVGLLTGAPALVREIQRRHRLRDIATGSRHAADAAWAELLDECTDRGIDVSGTDTLRLTAQKMAEWHRLDERARQDLRTVVMAVERAWYGGTGGGHDEEFEHAFAGVRESLHRHAPLSWRGRLLPRSVLRRRSRR